MELQSEIISLKKKSRLAVISIIILIFLLIISLIFFPLIASLIYRDLDSFDDSDLALNLVPTEPEADNAYNVLIQFPASLDLSEEEYQTVKVYNSGKAWDQNFTTNILSKQKKALDGFKLAASKSFFQDPLYADLEKIDWFKYNFSLLVVNQTAALNYLSALNYL